MSSPRRDILTGSNWRDYLDAPRVVLTLGRTDCGPCVAFEEELTAFLGSSTEWADVRFGKILLDTRGFHVFKKQNPWLRHAEILPIHIVYSRGEAIERFTGGLEVLVGRLRATWPRSERRTCRVEEPED